MALSSQHPVSSQSPRLERAFGTLRATALNMTQVIGAGIFISIPPMLGALAGPYALLGWVAGGVLMIFDGMIWSELGATIPGSGGSYLYLLECYGPRRWGRLMAFLFIWQFLISGPLEISTAPIAIAQFAGAIFPQLPEIDARHGFTFNLARGYDLKMTVNVSTAIAVLITACIVGLLYRNITSLGKITVTFWIGVLVAIGWILAEGVVRFDPAVAFDRRGIALSPRAFWIGLGASMIPAMYSYLGYYNVCYIGDEVRDPGRTIPRSIFLCSVLICALFILVHLAMLGTISWRVALADEAINKNLAAEFMRHIHGNWAARLITALIIWSSLGSIFAGILGYSRVPYGAAKYGHFFSVLARVHPIYHFPYVSLLLIGGLTMFWCLFDLEKIISALITTRILEQFLGQVVGVILLRIRQPQRYRPYKMLLYPLPCLIAFVGWIFMYFSAGKSYISLGLATLAVGGVVFLIWTSRTGQWPFGPEDENPVQ